MFKRFARIFAILMVTIFTMTIMAPGISYAKKRHHGGLLMAPFRIVGTTAKAVGKVASCAGSVLVSGRKVVRLGR